MNNNKTYCEQNEKERITYTVANMCRNVGNRNFLPKKGTEHRNF